LTLLRATGLAAATDALVRVKSHYPEVDVIKIKGGADTTKDLHALELEVGEAATEVDESIDFEGDDRSRWRRWRWQRPVVARSCTSPSSLV
jgi:hypothetical protein